MLILEFGQQLQEQGPEAHLQTMLYVKDRNIYRLSRLNDYVRRVRCLQCAVIAIVCFWF
jgi:hypothetical protein